MIRILLVDDQNIVRQGLQALLEPKPEFQIVGTAEDGKSAIEQVEILRPDVVLIDIEMPGMSGITATYQICQQFPITKILVLSSHESQKYIAQALHAGAEGYLLKNTLAEDLEQAILSVYRGLFQIESKLIRGLLASPAVSQSNTSALVEQNGLTLVGKQLVQTRSFNKLPTNFGNISKIKIEASTSQKNGASFKIDETTVKSTFEPSIDKTKKLPNRNKDTLNIINSPTERGTIEPSVQQKPQLKLHKSNKKPSFKLLLPIGLLFAAIAGVIWYLGTSSDVPQPLEVSGRIEGYETNISAKVAGRVNHVEVREGDSVGKNQVIVRMDDKQIQAQLRGADARIIAAQQEEEEARLQIDVLKNQIREIQLNLQQAEEDAKGKVAQAEASWASSQAQFNEAKANLERAKAELKLVEVNRDRYNKLVQDGAINQQQFDRVQTDYETAVAAVKARQNSVESLRQLADAAQGQTQQARTNILNPHIRKAQIASLRTQLAQARTKLVAAQANVNNAQAAQQEIQSQVTDLNIISPLEGVVITRSVEPGTVVTAGKTMLTIINPDEVYLRGFISEGEVGKIKVGQSAKVFLDSAPEKPLSAKISAIDTEASFTPDNIYFKEDRVKQVFGVKIAIDRADGLAKPGMPADAEIITE